MTFLPGHGRPLRKVPRKRGLVSLASAAALAGAALAAVPVTASMAAPALPPGVTLATGDSRQVSQPSIPATCTTLSAGLATSNAQFASSAEQSPPDTSRLQSALNGCAGSNKAVVLAASGSSNAFLSGPLSLPGGVTMVIDSGVTLYASRNPASYQVSGKRPAAPWPPATAAASRSSP